MFFCPFCESTFNRYQHLGAFTEDALRQLLESHGFRVLFCRGLNLNWFSTEARAVDRWQDKLRRIWLRPLDWCFKLWDTFQPRSFPANRRFTGRVRPGFHLVAVVQRPPESGSVTQHQPMPANRLVNPSTAL